jgi:CRP/FNR family transcriptional regulator, anaerobic regulatory protein
MQTISFQNQIPARSKADCRLCPSRALCLGACSDDAGGLAEAVHLRNPLANPGQPLYGAGDSAGAVFIVRAGCIKTFTVDAEGNEQVRGFHFPGDVVGLDALGRDRYPSHAAAVVASQVCTVPMTALRTALATTPAVGNRLLQHTSEALASALALSGDYTADQRVAAFLLLMRARMPAGLHGPDRLRLPMPRRDIANYLRLATETVCRVLTRFQKQGWIESTPKDLRILGADALYRLASPVGIAPEPEAVAQAA